MTVLFETEVLAISRPVRTPQSAPEAALQIRARCRYNPNSYRDRACPAGFWHVIDPIAKPNPGMHSAEEGRMATCPECDAQIEVDEFDVDKGDQLSCPECGSNLEVTGLSPIELDIAPEDDEEDEDDADLTGEADDLEDGVEEEDDEDQDQEE
jgi:alpha-aminoadipate carrier protein LysW